MKHLIALPLLALLLSACQTSSTVRESLDGSVYRQLEGSTLVLNQDLNIAAERARVFIQNGAVRTGFNSFKTHCAFEIDSIRHDGAVIRGGSFAVSRVQAAIVQVVMREPLRLAALWRVDGMDGGGSQSYYAGYHFWLTSADQPQVRRMSCFGVYAEPGELYPPTVEEIRAALGPVATLQ